MLNKVAIAFGSGGHKAQAARLKNYLANEGLVAESDFYYIVENDVTYLDQHEKKITIPPVRHKYSHIKSFFMLLFVPVSIVRIMIFLRKNDIQLVVSPGPGCAIVSALACKLGGANFVFVESWSRFYSLSFSGKICRFLSDEFLVQNESLTRIHSGSKYVGRL